MAEKAQTTRVYHLTDGTSQWLVRAPSRAQAIAHIVRQRVRCEVADQDTLIIMLGRNFTVQDATAPTEKDAEMATEGEQA